MDVKDFYYDLPEELDLHRILWKKDQIRDL